MPLLVDFRQLFGELLAAQAAGEKRLLLAGGVASSTLLRELILPACILSLLALGVIRAAHRAALSRAPQTSLFSLGVRLND